MQENLNVKSVPFRGGCNTYLEPALLEPGKYSSVQNFRQMHPGLKKRPGQIKLHTTADSTNRVMSLFQFSKGKKTERHLYAQMSDGDVLEATAGPPIGNQLGPLKVNTMQIVKEINEKTKELSGMKVPVKIIVDTETKKYTVFSVRRKVNRQGPSTYR